MKGRNRAPVLGKAEHRVEGFANTWHVIRCGTDARKQSLVILSSKAQWRRAGRGAERAQGGPGMAQLRY